MRTLTGDHGKSCTFIPARSRESCRVSPHSSVTFRSNLVWISRRMFVRSPPAASCSDQCTELPCYSRHQDHRSSDPHPSCINLYRSTFLFNIEHTALWLQLYCPLRTSPVTEDRLSSPVTKSKSHTKRKSGLRLASRERRAHGRWTWTHADALGRVGRRRTPHNHNTYTPDTLQSLQRTTLPTHLYPPVHAHVLVESVC